MVLSDFNRVKSLRQCVKGGWRFSGTLNANDIDTRLF